MITLFPECHLETVLLFRSATSTGDVTPIYCNEHENFDWVTQIQEALQTKLSDIWLICDKDPNSGIIGMINCLNKEMPEQKIR